MLYIPKINPLDVDIAELATLFDQTARSPFEKFGQDIFDIAVPIQRVIGQERGSRQEPVQT